MVALNAGGIAARRIGGGNQSEQEAGAEREARVLPIQLPTVQLEAGVARLAADLTAHVRTRQSEPAETRLCDASWPVQGSEARDDARLIFGRGSRSAGSRQRDASCRK